MSTTTSQNSSSILRAYYYLTKPGIVYGNTIAAVAGYFFGAGSSAAVATVLSLTVGIALVIASACTYNNILDRDIDAVMQRTKKRAMVQKSISTLHAFLFGTFLLVLGLAILLLGTNLLAMLFALFGHIAYALLYTFTKRITVHGTLIGTISGSTPPVIGYAAATGQVDLTALLLFLILVTWQMPHFYAIALFQREDYQNAGIPVLPVVKGERATRRQIIVYVLLFIAACIALGFVASSLLTTLVLTLSGFYWLYLCLQSTEQKGGIVPWARHQFGWSLTVLLLLCTILALDPFFH